MDEARHRGAILQAVHSWTLPMYLTGFAVPAPIPPELLCEVAEEARAELDKALRHLPPHPSVQVEEMVREGHPSTSLLAVADGAVLLVVGRRGRGKLAELLLGSTSRECVEHATCPVLVVPSPAHAAAAPDERELASIR